jgi:hypothetical protein
LAVRTFQLDPEVKPIFTAPNHPSYPAAHACSSIAIAKVLGYLFPRDAATLDARGERAASGLAFISAAILSQVGSLPFAVAKRLIDRAARDEAEP